MNNTDPHCTCRHFSDGSVYQDSCPLHARRDPCAVTAQITGRRRKGTIRRGVCTNCGHDRRKTAQLAKEEAKAAEAEAEAETKAAAEAQAEAEAAEDQLPYDWDSEEAQGTAEELRAEARQGQEEATEMATKKELKRKLKELERELSDSREEYRELNSYAAELRRGAVWERNLGIKQGRKQALNEIFGVTQRRLRLPLAPIDLGHELRHQAKRAESGCDVSDNLIELGLAQSPNRRELRNVDASKYWSEDKLRSFPGATINLRGRSVGLVRHYTDRINAAAETGGDVIGLATDFLTALKRRA